MAFFPMLLPAAVAVCQVCMPTPASATATRSMLNGANPLYSELSLTPAAPPESSATVSSIPTGPDLEPVAFEQILKQF